MRPTAQHHDPDNTGRIIYLGDVRRRRSGKRRAPDRHYLAALLLIAAVAWSLWLTVLFTLSPARLLTYAAFFAPLWVALSATGAIGAHAVDWRRGFLPSLRTCTRRGLLFATVVVANLAFQAAHRWSLPVAAISIALAVGIDLAWARRHGY